MYFIQNRKNRPARRKGAAALIIFGLSVSAAAGSAYSQAANTGNGDWEKQSSKIHWPTGHTPNDADLFAHNELFIKAPCSAVWQHIVQAPQWPQWYPNSNDVRIVSGKSDMLVNGSRFEWNTFGIDIDSTVHEFVLYRRVGWFGKGKDIDAYHTWFLTTVPDGCQVVTEEAAKGPGAIAIRKADPDAMHKGHGLWLASLKRLSEALDMSPIPNPTQKSYGKVLIVLSSETRLPLKDGKTFQTGYYLNELLIPAQRFSKAGYELVFTDPKGNTPAIDINSVDVSYFGGSFALSWTNCPAVGCGQAGWISTWRPNTIQDRESITGQNPFSDSMLMDLALETLSKQQ